MGVIRRRRVACRAALAARRRVFVTTPMTRKCRIIGRRIPAQSGDVMMRKTIAALGRRDKYKKPVQERPVYKQRSQEEHSVLTFLFLYIIKPLFSVIIYRYYITVINRTYLCPVILIPFQWRKLCTRITLKSEIAQLILSWQPGEKGQNRSLCVHFVGK